MNYKYKKNQLFGKRLKLPKEVLVRIYSNRLNFTEYIKFNLEDKIPINCMTDIDVQIIKKFGLDKCKNLDWELLGKIDIKKILLTLDSNLENLNYELYKILRDKIDPSNYSSQMKNFYPDRFFIVAEDKFDQEVIDLQKKFNEGSQISFDRIIFYWDLFKSKDLTFIISKSELIDKNITSDEIKRNIEQYKDVIAILSKYGEKDIFEHVEKYLSDSSQIEEKIKASIINLLNIKGENHVNVSNEDYQEIFKYISFENYFNAIKTNVEGSFLVDELNNLPNDYISKMKIPFDVFFNDNKVWSFVKNYGIKSIVDFDENCGHFFSSNNFENLLEFYNCVHYNYSNISVYSPVEENRPYTQEEFQKSLRMLFELPTIHMSYDNITGKFRENNEDIFISKDAPEELKKFFYTKKLSSELLIEHPEYVPYLYDKNILNCFEVFLVEIDGKIKNIYEFFYSKLSSKEFLNFIINHGNIIDYVKKNNNSLQNIEESDFCRISSNDNVNDVLNYIIEVSKKLIYYEVVKKGEVYPDNLHQLNKKSYPEMFLSGNAPEELRDKFYKRKINYQEDFANPNYIEYLKEINFEILFNYMVVGGEKKLSLIKVIAEKFGKDEFLHVMNIYGKYLNPAYEVNNFENVKFDSNFSIEEFMNEFEKCIYYSINYNNILYDDKLPNEFRKNYPHLFLDTNIDSEIQRKYYEKKFIPNDFVENVGLLNHFKNTNIVYGMIEKYSWLNPLYNKFENQYSANEFRLMIIDRFDNMKDEKLKDVFKNFVLKFGDGITSENIDVLTVILNRLYYSNSTDMYLMRDNLANELLNTENPIESLNKIEEIFLKNNLPLIGKKFSCFEILHPNFKGFDFKSEKMSPVLMQAPQNFSRKWMIFADLMLITLGSNNRSIYEYVNNIENYSSIYECMKSGNTQYESLNPNDLISFRKYLSILYNKSTIAIRKKEEFELSDNVIQDIFLLAKKISPTGDLNYNLGDRIVSMFCGRAGFDTLEKVKSYIGKKMQTADEKNRLNSNYKLLPEEGDFVKGIGDIKYLGDILQNGSISKEYLGGCSVSDSTPLDTDISIIAQTEDKSTAINHTAAKMYGPIYLILKNDDRFVTTRNDKETFECKRNISKMEVFHTGVLGIDHYGIRTGFASSEIDYIVMDNYDNRVGLEIALNGFYIPVVNKKGSLVFSPKDYDDLREKMQGLSYFNEYNYSLSPNIVCDDTIFIANQLEESDREISIKRNVINKILIEALKEVNLDLKTYFDGDLTEGTAELLDTGSTGRGTNKPGDGDFDFMLRLDRSILLDAEKLQKVKKRY